MVSAGHCRNDWAKYRQNVLGTHRQQWLIWQVKETEKVCNGKISIDTNIQIWMEQKELLGWEVMPTVMKTKPQNCETEKSDALWDSMGTMQ